MGNCTSARHHRGDSRHGRYRGDALNGHFDHERGHGHGFRDDPDPDHAHENRGRGLDPMGILDMRVADGEFDEDECHRRRSENKDNS